MSALRFVLGDQLTRGISSLVDLDPAEDVVLMVEVLDETTYVPHHKQKIALILSAMRHFAQELRQEGVRVDYIQLEDEGNTGSFDGELARAVARHAPQRIVVTEPGEWRVRAMMDAWRDAFDIPVEIRPDDRFLCSLAAFGRFAEKRERLVMETFYRAMRRKTGYLMQNGEPVGGRWNFDAENRKRMPKALAVPPRPPADHDPITLAVLALVERRFNTHFGDLGSFAWPVTRADALAALKRFVEEALPSFGDYQDAMREGADFVFHSLLSPALNIGLLTAAEVCEAAIAAYERGGAPLNAVEGFVRQILGWREFVRGLYWTLMPDYAETNALGAARGLPWFYWSGETEMNCLRDVIGATRRNAYAHHIQRLMVTGNFALLAGIAPREIEEWYLVVYADAFEWVELPNTHGMAIFADGGVMGTKPYAASGAYIDRMSDYCPNCRFDVKAKSGEGACPFNYLYWNFLIANEARLANNHRLAMPYRNLQRMSPERRAEIVADAKRFLDGPHMRVWADSPR